MSSLPVEPSGSETLISASTYERADSTDDSFIRHHKYFFKDGNVTFLVDGTLYCVHRYFFSRDSMYFSARFDQLGIRDHEALPITISLGNIERKDFEAFLSILYPENFEQHDLSYEEWKSVLDLSTCWDFTSVRRLALNNIQPPTPHDRLLLARTYSVDHWVIPALSALCERGASISLDEARQMDIEDVVLVTTVREDIRSRNLQVDAAEIPRRVEAAQAGKPVHIDSVDVSPAVPTSGAVEQVLSSLDEEPASKDRVTDESVGEVLEKQATPDDISGQREELQQPLEDRQAKATAKPKPEVEKVRRMVEAAMLKADEGKMIKWKAQAEKHAVEEARVSDLKAKAESAECKAQAAEREAEAAKVVILEAATELEKAAASEVRHAASSAAKVAREEAKKARKAATKAANRAAQLWCT
jgi:hypothetical protein